MIAIPGKDKRRGVRGASLLEMAIALPVFLVLLMGTIDLGLAVNQYLAISRATYESLRYTSALFDNRVACIGEACPSRQVSGRVADRANLEKTQLKVRQVLTAAGYPNAKVTLEVNLKWDEVFKTHQYKLIKTTIEIPFKGITPFAHLIPIKTTFTFTDLYNDRVGKTGESL